MGSVLVSAYVFICCLGGDMSSCIECGDEVSAGRSALGYKVCLVCGEAEARQIKHCIAIPYNKGAYQYISNMELLKQTNPKRTTC